jgi:Spy/CpxP family protein refolding chaperone
MMRWFIVPMILLSWLGTMAAPPASVARAAQPQKPTKQPARAAAKTMAARASKQTAARTVRLPRYFGQIGLDDAQRTKVRETEESYQSRSQRLLAELKKLRADRDKQLASLLTPAQQKKLEDFRARRTNRAARKKKLPGKSTPVKSAANTPQS